MNLAYLFAGLAQEVNLENLHCQAWPSPLQGRLRRMVRIISFAKTELPSLQRSVSMVVRIITEQSCFVIHQKTTNIQPCLRPFMVFEKHKSTLSCICLSYILFGNWKVQIQIIVYLSFIYIVGNCKVQIQVIVYLSEWRCGYLAGLVAPRWPPAPPSQPFKDDPSETSTKRNIYVI